MLVLVARPVRIAGRRAQQKRQLIKALTSTRRGDARTLTPAAHAPRKCESSPYLTVGCKSDGERHFNRGRYQRRDAAWIAARQSDRRACRRPGALSPHAARHEPGKARREAGADVPASPEVREGHQPHRRQPAVRSRAGAGRAGAVFLRGGAIRAASAGSVPTALPSNPAENSIVEFLRSRDGLELNKAFVRISDAKARRAIVDLVAQPAPTNEAADDNRLSRAT